MKAAVTEGRGDIRLVDVPVPEAGSYRCLCKTLACATCTGTELKVISSRIPWQVSYPGIVGHESVGVVLQPGEKARYVKKGDVYLRPTAVYSGSRLGAYDSMLGGFSEYGLITDTKAFMEDNPGAPLGYSVFQMKVPAGINVSAADLTSVITLKETAGYVGDIGFPVNSSVVILGAGPVAMAMAFFAKINGAFPLICVARRDEPLEYMKRFGVNRTVNIKKEDLGAKVMEATGGMGAEYIIDTAGAAGLFLEAFKTLAPGGRMAPYATYDHPEKLKAVDSKFIINAKTGEVLTHQYIFDLVRMGVINLKNFYSHRMPFKDITRGFEMLKEKKAFKIVFEMDAPGGEE